MFDYVKHCSLLTLPQCKNNVVNIKSDAHILVPLDTLPPNDYHPEDFAINSLIDGNVNIEKTSSSTNEITLDTRDSSEKNIAKIINSTKS